MKYVALLRGINVGGKARVEMPRLKQVFEGLGYNDVRTYINSGNILFSSDKKQAGLAREIEAAINHEFGFVVPVVVRNDASLAALCKAVPVDWTNDSALKTDVIFLWDQVNSPDILDKIVINPKLENVKYTDGALIWSIARENVARGNGIKLVKTDLYAQMTIRNINTVRKLHALLRDE